MATVYALSVHTGGKHCACWFARAEDRDAYALHLPGLLPGDEVSEWCAVVGPLDDITRAVQRQADTRSYTPSARYTVPEPQSGR